MSAPDRTHCRVCDRPRATQDDFDKIAPGDGAHLCWGAWDEGACYSARVDWYERAMAARAARDAATQAFDDLVAQVWTVATGSTHEGPASVDALLNAVLDLRNARDAAALPVGHVAVDRALYEAACRLAADVPRLQREVASARREGAVAAWGVAFDALGAPMPPEANGTGEYEVATVARTVRSVVAAERDVARREGAEAMREACAAECEGWAAVHDARETMHGALGRVDEFGIDIAYEAATARAHWRDASAAIRALPLPGGEP